jgi:hypothetical protein
MKNDISQNSGIIDDAIDTTECVDRGLDDPVGRFPACNAVAIRDGLSTRSPDLVGHLLCGVGIAAPAAGRSSKVIHDDFGALARRFQRNASSDAPTAAGNNDDFALKHAHFVKSRDSFMRFFKYACILSVTLKYWTIGAMRKWLKGRTRRIQGKAARSAQLEDSGIRFIAGAGQTGEQS